MVLKKTFRPHKIFGQNLLSQTVLAFKNWEKKNCSKFFLVIQVKKKSIVTEFFPKNYSVKRWRTFFNPKESKTFLFQKVLVQSKFLYNLLSNFEKISADRNSNSAEWILSQNMCVSQICLPKSFEVWKQDNCCLERCCLD